MLRFPIRFPWHICCSSIYWSHSSLLVSWCCSFCRHLSSSRHIQTVRHQRLDPQKPVRALPDWNQQEASFSMAASYVYTVGAPRPPCRRYWLVSITCLMSEQWRMWVLVQYIDETLEFCSSVSIEMATTEQSFHCDSQLKIEDVQFTSDWNKEPRWRFNVLMLVVSCFSNTAASWKDSFENMQCWHDSITVTSSCCYTCMWS